MRAHRAFSFALLAVFLLTACGPSPADLATGTSFAATSTAASWTETPLPTFTSTVTQTSTSTPYPTVTRFPTAKPTKTPTRRPTSTRRPTNTPQANTWDRYKPRTLKAIIKANMGGMDTLMNNSIFINYGDDFASKVDVTYTGEFRDVSGQKLTLIVMWGATFAPQVSSDQFRQVFQKEGLFIEDGVEYWLPVQSQLIPYMKDELTIDGPVTLLVVWPGATKFDNVLDWVFLVNNFPITP